MNTIYKLITTIAVCLALCSCNSWFDGMLDDETPKNDLVPENAIVDEKSSEKALLGAYSYLDDSQYNGGYLNLDLIVHSYVRLNLITSTSASTFEKDQLFKFAYDETNSSFEYPWRHVYKMINAANNVIYYTEQADDDRYGPDRKNEILAEARFLRAFCNMYLLERYGQFYDLNSEYGIILRTEPSALSYNNRARAKVADSYESIFDDLRFAAENGPAFTSAYRVCKTTAKAFLANYLLVRGTEADRQEALRLVEEVLASGDFTLEKNYADIFEHKHESSELMFTQHTNEPNSYDANVRGLAQQLGKGQYRPKKYEEDDAMSVYFNIVEPDTTERYIATHDSVTFPKAKTKTFVWKKFHTLNKEAIPMYYMRLAQLYLLKAEILSYQAGATISDVLGVMNVLRERANEAPFDSNAFFSMEEVREEIFREYIRELGVENADPYFYAVRTMREGKRLLYKYNVNFVDDRTLCYPIPAKEIETNNLAKQNPY
ncbi:MAG: RagB/SusD family nutrient uptake outer membrane protein [Prevotella sp.]